MNINGKALGWSIVCFVLFITLVFNEVTVETVEFAIFELVLLFVFAWGFAESLGRVFI